MDKNEILSIYADHINPSKVRVLRYAGLDIVESEREGIFVYDKDGKRYIDCFCGAGTFNIGHRNPQIIAALVEAVENEKIDIGNFTLFSSAEAELANKLAEIAPGDLSCVMFGTGGGEAVDFAIKLARGFTLKQGIISMESSYHGHTGFALSAIGRDVYRTPFEPLMPGFKKVPYGDLESLEKEIDENTAAVIVEVVQGEGGVHVAPPGYLEGIRRLCDKTQVLLIIDEIQTGMGRTGRMFACEHWHVVPDIMTVAKSLGGGLYPISATVYRKELQDFIYMNPFIHLSTFGGADIGCRVALAAIDYIQKNNLPSHAESMGKQFEEGFLRLKQMYPDLLIDVRRLGLMIGLEYSDPSLGPRMSLALANNGVIAIYSANQPSVMRIMPPLIIQANEVSEVLNAFERAMDQVNRQETVDRKHLPRVGSS